MALVKLSSLSIFILYSLVAAIKAATLTGPFTWLLSETTITPDNPYCFTKSPATAVVAFDGTPSISPTNHCSACFGLWKDLGRDEYCIFFTPGTGNKLKHDKANRYLFPVVATDGTAVVASATVTLDISKDSSPYFTIAPFTVARTVAVGAAVDDVIYTVEVDDLEENPADLQYLLEPSAFSSFFDIVDGDVIVKETLDNLCADVVDLDIRVSDGFNPTIGPLRLTVTIDRAGNSYKPQMSNANKNKYVEENTKSDFAYFSGDVKAGGSCTVTADPPSLLSYYAFVCSPGAPYFIQTKQANFEVNPPVNYTIIYNDGHCDSDPFWYQINWVNALETPSVSATPLAFTTTEGFLRVEPSYVLVDDDTTETYRYDLLSDPSGRFTIDDTTGYLYTTQYFTLTNQASQTILLDVAVTDSGNLQSNMVQLTVNVLDINDNRPVLDPFTTTYTFSDCSTLGLIATLTAQDNDAGTNADITFIPATSQSMRLDANGEVYLRAQPIPNNVDTLIIRARDQGVPYKTSLDGTISNVGSNCPTTTTLATTTVTTTTAPTTTATPTTTPPSSTSVASTTTASSSSSSSPVSSTSDTPVTTTDTSTVSTTLTTTAAVPTSTTDTPSTTVVTLAPIIPTAAASTASFFDDPYKTALVIIGSLLFLVILVALGYVLYRVFFSGTRKEAEVSTPVKNNTIKPSSPPSVFLHPSSALKPSPNKDAESAVYSDEGFADDRAESVNGGRSISVVSRNGITLNEMSSPDFYNDSNYFNDNVVGKPPTATSISKSWTNDNRESSQVPGTVSF